MARSIWKGNISFGLVSVPIKLYPATEPKGIKFNFLHEECKTPLNYQRYCQVHRKVVDWAETVKGYQYEPGKYVILKDEDFEKIPLKSVRTIDIIDFVDLEEIDPIYFEKSYYLEPQEESVKAYFILVQVMMRAGKVAVAKVALREKEHFVLLRPYKDVLLMETMFYPEEIRSEKEIKEMLHNAESSKEELKLAQEFIEALSAKFVPEKYTDEYRKALLKLIRAKIEGKAIPTVAKEEVKKAKNLMEALKASVQAAKKKQK